MTSIKKVWLLTALVPAVAAFSAASASADIEVIGGDGSAYHGAVEGINTGPDPTLETGTTTIVCEVATVEGTMLGATPATADLTFGWDQCRIVGGVGCSVDDIPNVDVALNEFSTAPDPNPENYLTAPDSNITNTETGSTFISCALAFNCTATSDPAAGNGAVSATVESDTQVADIDDTVEVTGLGCPSTGQWVAQYEITVPADGLRSDLND